MKSLLRSRRAKLLAILALVIGLILAFPLSMAFSLFGLKDMGVSARSLRGPVWWGVAEELTVGGIRLGTVNVLLDPFHLLIGQAQVDLLRVNGRPDDFVGALLVGPAMRGVERVTANVPLGATFAPLPVTRAEFEQFSARFSGGLCTKAEGRVRLRVAPVIAGLELANGLAGDARCEGAALLLPLASQSGQERLELRIRADGGYEATMRVRSADPALAIAGFQPVGGEQVLRIAGSL